MAKRHTDNICKKSPKGKFFTRLATNKILGDVHMKVTKTAIAGVVILEPQVFGDHRGFFMESWNKKQMEAAGLFYDFVQDNNSWISKEQLLASAEKYGKSPYGQHLKKVAEGKILY